VIAGWAPDWLSSNALWAINLGVSLAIIATLFAAIFKYVPDAQVAWRDIIPGAIVTAILFVLGQFLISLYLSWSDPTSAFGATGSLALILLWIYYSALIVLIGAEFTEVWARRRGADPEPEPGAMRIRRVQQPA
jgi:membrane protein